LAFIARYCCAIIEEMSLKSYEPKAASGISTTALFPAAIELRLPKVIGRIV
jgi:hypothetical protein